MANYDFEVTLVSGIINLNLDSSYGADPYEAFEYYFCNYGGTEILYDITPCLKDGISSLPKDSSFAGLIWNSDDEMFEGSTPNYEIKTTSGDQNTGWDYDFHLMTSFLARASAECLEDAIEKVRSEVHNGLAMYDAGSTQILEIASVRIIHQT
jgi:hypothetical protein